MKNNQSQCACKKVRFEVINKPIITVACYCDSCQVASKYLESLPQAPSLTEEDGSTHFVMYRKDRVECTKGQDLLREYKLTPESPTRRIIASCCNTPMFLEFKDGHWLSMYMNQFDENGHLPIETRTMTKYRREGVEFNDTIPSPESHTVMFMVKLMIAWAKMGFKTPKVDYVKGSI